MKKKRVRNPNGCINCGRECTVDCIDNHGNAYKGCPNCRIVLPNPTAMTVDELRAEVEGGRIAYGHLVEIKEQLEAKVKWMQGNLDGERRAVALLQKQLRTEPKP